MATASRARVKAADEPLGGPPADQTTPLQILLDFFLFLALFVTPWIISTQLKEVFNTTKNIWVGVVVIFAALAWLTSCTIKREIRIPKGKVVLLYTALMAWSLLTIAWSIWRPLSLVEYSYQLAMFALFLVAYCNVRDKQRIENLLHFSIAAGVITAGYALMQYYGLDEAVFTRLTSFFRFIVPASWEPWFDFRFLILPPKPDEATKIYSTMGHRNYLAGYMIAVLPITLSRLYAALGSVFDHWSEIRERAHDRGNLDPFEMLGLLRAPIVYGASILLMFSVVLICHTRGAWVGFTIAITFFIVFLNLRFRIYAGKRRSAIVIALFAFMVLLFGPTRFGLGEFSVKNPFNREPMSILQRASDVSRVMVQSSVHQRLLIYRTALYIIFDRPSQFLFGTGFGTFGLHYMPYQQVVIDTESHPPIQKAIDRFFEKVFFGGHEGFEHFLPELNKSIYAHNEVLHFWSEIGLVGVGLMLALLVCYFRDAFVYLWRAPAGDESLLFLGMMSSVVGVLGHNLFTFDLHLAYTSALFWFLIAACQRYTPREYWVFRWRPYVADELELGGRRFRAILQETPEGAVAARCKLLPDGGERAAGEAVTDWSLELTDPGGEETTRRFGKSVQVEVRRPAEAGCWTAALRSPEGECRELRLERPQGSALSSWLFLGSMGIAALLLFNELVGQALTEHHWRNGFLKFRARQFEDSYLDYKMALRYNPWRGEVLFDFGRALMDAGRNKFAIEIFERATKSFVDPANFHNVALCYYKEGDLSNAERSYRRAIELNPIYEQSLLNLAFLLMDRAGKARAEGREDEAKALDEEAAQHLGTGERRLYKKNPQFSSTLGALRAQQGQFDKAVEHLQIALKLAPNDCKTLINYGTILYNLGRHDEALAAMRKANEHCKGDEGERILGSKYVNVLKGYYHKLLTEKPNDPSVITSYGRDLIEAGKFAEAQDVFQKLLAGIAPGDPQALYWQAVALLKQGFRSQARTQLERLSQAVPADSPLARDVKARLAEIRKMREAPIPAGLVTTSPLLPLTPLPTQLPPPGE